MRIEREVKEIFKQTEIEATRGVYEDNDLIRLVINQAVDKGECHIIELTTDEASRVIDVLRFVRYG